MTEKQKALQKCDQAGAPIDASQLAQALSSALGVRTLHGADGKTIRLLPFGGPLAGLLFELPPEQGSCHDCGTGLESSYVAACEEKHGTIPARCGIFKTDQ